MTVAAAWTFEGHPIHSLSREPEGAVRGPAILLVHGFGASTDHWRFNIPVLAQTHEVHALDLLGFGDRKSTRLNSSHVSESRMPSSA